MKRRDFLKKAAGLAASAGALSVVPVLPLKNVPSGVRKAPPVALKNQGWTACQISICTGPQGPIDPTGCRGA